MWPSIKLLTLMKCNIRKKDRRNLWFLMANSGYFSANVHFYIQHYMSLKSEGFFNRRSSFWLELSVYTLF